MIELEAYIGFLHRHDMGNWVGSNKFVAMLYFLPGHHIFTPRWVFVFSSIGDFAHPLRNPKTLYNTKKIITLLGKFKTMEKMYIRMGYQIVQKESEIQIEQGLFAAFLVLQ